MLEMTLASEFVPGTNLKGEVSGANWLFLLPQIDLDCVVCFGLPAGSSLVALARLTSEVLVIADGAAQQLDDLVHKHSLANVRSLFDTRSLPDASVALAMVATTDALENVGKGDERLAELRRILKPDGCLYVEQPGLFVGKREHAAIDRLAQAVGAPQRFWLTPMSGEMHTAVAEQDQATSSYFLQHGLTSRSINLAALKRAIRARGATVKTDSQSAPAAQVSAAPTSVARRRGLKAHVKGAARTTLASIYHGVQSAFDGVEQHLNRSAMLGELTRRYGVLVRRGEPDDGPPRYLRTIARTAGLDIGAYRWGLSARGEYSSRKVLIFLFERASPEPTYIVKMTRDPALNERLENEQRALKYLAEHEIGDAETLPQVAFHGHHNRLAVVGESIVKGTPFEEQSRGTTTCPYLYNAAGWLTDLSAATADCALATPAQAAAVLARLFERFAEIYPLAPAHQHFMSELLATMGRSASRFPLVFQHGDPGTWNIWVTPTGRTAFLDWEAAEVHGMPLWDLFYFIRTYGAWASRATISGDVSKGFGDQFLTSSPFQTLMIDLTARYCEQVGLAAELIEPLFYTCWMHRGLKEATRLTKNTLARGHYFNVLCESIDRRAALQRLFAPTSTMARSL